MTGSMFIAKLMMMLAAAQDTNLMEESVRLFIEECDTLQVRCLRKVIKQL